MSRRLLDERGQSLVMAIIFMTALLGMAGLVLDVGSWFRTQRAAQSAADAAALAGAQSLPQDPTEAATVASSTGDANGGGLPDDAQHITFSPSGDTIHVTVDRPTGSFFSQVLGVVSPTVHAQAAARSFIPGSAKYVAPIGVYIKHPMLEGSANCPCYGSENATSITLGKVSDGSDQIPGAFVLIDLDKNDNGTSGSSTVASWITNGFGDYLPLTDYYSDTGAKFTNNSIQAALAARLDTDLLFPVYDSVSGTGSGAQYDVVAWAVFHLTYVPPGNGNAAELDGYFQETIWDGIQSTTGDNSPDLGVHSIELVQ
jgi:hypothetical protein